METERLELAGELLADEGPEWAEKYKPGSYGCHELLDRTSQLMDSVDRFVLSHPACIADPGWFTLAEQAHAALFELYQSVGAVHLEATSKNDEL